MELRHLRYFLAVAEELHFTRAAERLHIEQSPLSRSIRELESDLGVQLFDRTRQGVRLTWSGQTFLDDVKRIFTLVDLAKTNARAAALGMRGVLRIALSDGIIPQRLAALLAECRNEEPDVDIRLFETPLNQQIAGLRHNVYDAGLARSADVGDALTATLLWRDSLMFAVPARHPLLMFKSIPLEKAIAYPLVLYHPQHDEGFYRQLERVLRQVDATPIIAEHAISHDLMLALVSAGYGIGFTCEAQISACQYAGVVVRPIAGLPRFLDTYLLRSNRQPSAYLDRFVDRLLPADASSELCGV